LKVELEALAGTTPGCRGKIKQAYLPYVGENDAKTESCIERLTRFALCVDVVKPGQKCEPDWNKAIDREFIVALEAEAYVGKDGATKQGSKVAFMGFWRLENPEVADVPKDHDSPGMRELDAVNELA